MDVKIFIVEDEFIVANDLRVILLQAGYKIIGIAASAEEAEQILKRDKPDLVLLDIRLDGQKSGIDLARKLKADNIAFVYISANSSQEILEEAKTTDPYGFIVKPFRKKDLLIAVDIALYRHKHSQQSRLRTQDILSSQLTALNNDSTINPQERFLSLAKSIQAHIPFDLIAAGERPVPPGGFDDLAYLRIGFDEYQFIGKSELMTIANLKQSVLSEIINNSPAGKQPVIFDDSISKLTDGEMPLKKVLFESFKLRSYLVFPVATSSGSWVHYFFYSRQRNVYSDNHIDLLNRLSSLLSSAAEKISDTAAPAPSPLKIPKNTGAASFSQGFEGIIGNHPLLLAALDNTRQVAPYNTSVLILGESGTGKENVARSIHGLSPRKNEAFVKVNCASIPATLIESELFGHQKGAFTGAVEHRKGKFEQAERGTIFLDEIGELPLEMQAKLLRVLQEKEIEIVGSSAVKKVNVRVIAATNRNLENEVANGTFRLDLYYRLNVFPITLPPLRERKSDIEALTLFFADKFCREFNKTFQGISGPMLEKMQAYDWPGNIRELVNVMEQSIILNDGKSSLELKRSLGAASDQPGNLHVAAGENVRQILRETEREYIISSLKKSNGLIRGVNGAAKLLNIKPTTLESKMAKLGIKREDFTNSVI